MLKSDRYDIEETETGPITKQYKSKTKVTQSQQPQQLPPQTPVTTPIPKVKKPRSDKQMEAFYRAKEKRDANLVQHNLNKKIQASKLLLENDIKPPQREPVREPEREPEQRQKPKKVVKQVYVDDESESEIEEIQYIRKKKPKKIIKKVYIDESSSEEEDRQIEKPRTDKHMKSQQMTKGPAIKVTQRNEPEQKPQQTKPIINPNKFNFV